MPCERLFSGTKQIATDRRASLGCVPFEELTVMKSAWGPEIYDLAAWNVMQVEQVDMMDFEQMLVEDNDCLGWDEESEEMPDNFELVL